MAQLPPSRSRKRRVAESLALAGEWRRLDRAATAAAIPPTILAVAAFRGAVDVLAHWLIPRPSLYGAERDQA